MEYTVLYYFMRFIAYICDWALALWRKDKTHKFMATPQPKTEWPRFLVQWNRLLQAVIAYYIAKYVFAFLIWLLC